MKNKINISKLVSVLMIVSIILSSHGIVLATETKIESEALAERSISAQSEEMPDYEIWLANTCISGFEGDGNGIYTNFLGFSDPIYKELGGGVLDNEPLYILSAEWDGLLNDDFKKNPNYVYETILMNYLMYSADSSYMNTEILDKVTAYGRKIYSKLAEKFGDGWEDIVKNHDITDLKQFYSNCQDIKNINEAIREVGDLVSDGKELTEKICDYLALHDVKESRILLLKQARTACANLTKPNSDFIAAADKMIQIMEDHALTYIIDQSIQSLWGAFLDECWSDIVEVYPVLNVVDFGKMGMDVLFTTSNKAANNLKLAMLYTCDYYFQLGMNNACGDFIRGESTNTAQMFNECFSAYLEFQMYGNEFAESWIKDCVNGGLLNWLINQIFYRENIEGAERLTQLCQSQNAGRQTLLQCIQKYKNIYHNLYKSDEWESWMGSVEEVPVTSVSFQSPTVYINHKEDIYLAYATVSPVNATNQNIIYSSSDSSILSVPENGGFGMVLGSGTVTVTATTEDGRYTATQTVIVNNGSALTETASGICGEDLHWVLYSNGTLNITGTGEMYDWGSGSDYGWAAPWSNYKNSILEIKLGNSVTSIGWHAFAGLNNLTKVEIPTSVTKIQGEAFEKCTSLVKVEIPMGVTSIGWGAFQYCTSLTKVEIPTSVISIGEWAFLDCTSLTKVEIPRSVTSIEEQTFSGCTGLTKIEIPIGVKNIGSSAFAKCTSLRKVEISESVTNIGSGAFSNCSNLEKVEIPKSVTNIGEYAFWNCDGLISVKITNGVLRIGDSAFEDCGNITEIEIPTSVTYIGNSAFQWCSNLTKAEILNPETYIGNRAFGNCGDLKIYGKKDSYSETYAEKNSIPFFVIGKLISQDNIVVEYPEETINGNISLHTRRLTEADEEYKNIDISDKLSDASISPEEVIFTAYDISLIDEENNVVQPSKTVTVKIPCPLEYDGKKCNIYRVNTDGSLTDMKAEYQQNFLMFETNHFSTYLITETKITSKADVSLGDVNGDEEVDIKDSALIKRHLAGWETEMDEQSADLDGDGEVTIKDSALIKRQLAGWTVE